MGTGRGVLKILGGIVFSVSLALVIVSVGMTRFTTRDSVRALLDGVIQPQVTAALRSSFGGANDSDIRRAVLDQCNEQGMLPGPSLDMGSFGGGGNMQVYVSCADLQAALANSTDAPATISLLATNAMANELYDYSYGCAFLDCMQHGKMLVVMSAEGNAFFDSVQLALLAATAAGAAILLAAYESWAERMRAVGTQMAFVGVSYFLILLGQNYALSAVPADVRNNLAAAGVDLGAVIGQAIKPMNDMLLAVFVAGVVLAMLGFLLDNRSRHAAKPDDEKTTEHAGPSDE